MFPGTHESPLADGTAAASSEQHPTSLTLQPPASFPAPHRRLRGAAVATAATLLPLVRLLDTLQPYVNQESVFRLRRRRIAAQLARVRAELQADRPKREALLHAFHTLGELVVEEAHDIDRNEVKQAAKEVVLATLKNAPALISAAHQARLLS